MHSQRVDIDEEICAIYNKEKDFDRVLDLHGMTLEMGENQATIRLKKIHERLDAGVLKANFFHWHIWQIVCGKGKGEKQQITLKDCVGRVLVNYKQFNDKSMHYLHNITKEGNTLVALKKREKKQKSESDDDKIIT